MPELRRISARVTVRKGTGTQWQISNPTLMDGELGYSTDARILKIGDGETKWNELPYYETQSGGINSPLSHAGDVFPNAEVETARDAIFYTQRQINKWNSCAEQDFSDGYSEVAATCESDGTI